MMKPIRMLLVIQSNPVSMSPPLPPPVPNVFLTFVMNFIEWGFL